jgi:hypothetical protein
MFGLCIDALTTHMRCFGDGSDELKRRKITVFVACDAEDGRTGTWCIITAVAY